MIELLPIDTDADTPREPITPPLELVEVDPPSRRRIGIILIDRGSLAGLARRRGLGPFLEAAAGRRNR